ncbi:MAG TPA: transcriptional repressor LexA [Xanthomonadaceae bacterium]|nr:transcriptional repressor LexA [Xanthomonadaceae bacterium]
MADPAHSSLSDTQRAILAFLRERIGQDGLPPSQLEICAAFGFRQNATAAYHLKALEAAGAIERLPHKARGLRLVDAPPAGAASAANPSRKARRHGGSYPYKGHRDERLLPVLGRVAAGAPIGADIGSDEQLLLDRHCFDPAPDYLLRVQGDSMRDDGILDGDLVAVKRASEAVNGRIVVARIDGEVTIKRLRTTADAVLLLPRNPDYAPIVVPADADFAIEGLYCGLVRRG